jgi:hypothetical protein
MAELIGTVRPVRASYNREWYSKLLGQYCAMGRGIPEEMVLAYEHAHLRRGVEFPPEIHGVDYVWWLAEADVYVQICK